MLSDYGAYSLTGEDALLTYSNASDSDWTARSTATGVLRANSFDTTGDYTAGIFADSKAGNVTRYSGDSSISGKSHCLNFAILDADGENNGAWTFDIASDSRIFGPAQTYKQYYIQWREKAPSAAVYTAYPGSGGSGAYADGQKHIILSHISASHTNNEVVIADSRQMGGPTLYWDANGTITTDWPYVSALNDYRMQSAVDNGGSAATYADCLVRYGLMAHYGIADNIGTPDLPQGGFYYLPDEWMTFEIRVDFTGGFSAVIVEVWCAHAGEAPVKINSETISVGTDNGGHRTAWFLPFNTNRTSNGGFDTYRRVDAIITSLSPINFPGGYTPVIAGNNSVLEVAAAALASGTWGTITTTNSFNPDPYSLGDTMFSYVGRAVYDGTQKVIQFFGGAHGSAGGVHQYLATYDLASNAWASPVDVPDGNSSYEHSYYNQTVDPTTGIVYMRSGFGSTNVKRFDQASRTFLSDWSPPGWGTNFGIVLEYHPDMNSILHGHYWGIGSRASGAGSWTTVTSANRIGDAGPTGAYSPRDSMVYMGGGTGSGAGQLWKIDSSGTMTSCTYPSGITLGVWDAGSASSVSMLLGGGPSSGIMAITKGGNIYRYTEGTDSWSGVIDTLPAGLPPGINDGGDWTGINMPELDCKVFIKLSSMTAVSTTMHIRKN